MLNIVTRFNNAKMINCNDLTIYTIHDNIVAIQLGESIKIRPETVLTPYVESDRQLAKQMALLGVSKFTKIPNEKFYALVMKLELTIADLNNILFNQ